MRVFGLGFVIKLLRYEGAQKPPMSFELKPHLLRMVYVAWVFDSHDVASSNMQAQT